MQNSDQIRILLKDIREVRQSKIRQGLQALNPSHVFVSISQFPILLSPPLKH